MQLSKLGPYELNKTIGKGGMGSVYQATDTTTGAQVAIKALNPLLAQSEGFRERFEAEVESLKTLRHDGIVRLYGYGEQDGILFYSMELVVGTSLEEELKQRRRFDWREVADIAIQLCHVLKHAHDHGVVHRDIKPANILIDSDNRVKLADFGIARLFGNTQLTTAGGVLGTADYMSPEQAEGRPVTDRCDQYSLGGVMYALLAGRTPFRAKSLPEMLQLQRFAEPEPVSHFARDTPPQLEKVIAQLLSKDPQQRFPNVKVLARHLEAMVKALTRPAHDDFAVRDGSSAGESPLIDPHDHMLGATRSENQNGKSHGTPTQKSYDSSGDSLDIEELSESDVPPDAATLNAEEDESRLNQLAAQPAATSFTMVDSGVGLGEEQATWKSIAAQAAVLVAMIALLTATAFYFTREKTADALHAEIMATFQSEKSENLRSIENEIADFLKRFPNDARVAEVEAIGERVQEAKLERKLELQARLDKGPYDQLLPIEIQFLRAGKLAELDIQRGADDLESLIALYDLPVPSEISEDENVAQRRAVCLSLAKQRLALIQDEIAELATLQLPQLRDRLEVAAELAETEPAEATGIYRALIQLFGNQKWATEAVAEAREKLDNLERSPTTKPTTTPVNSEE